MFKKIQGGIFYIYFIIYLNSFDNLNQICCQKKKKKATENDKTN